MAAALLQRKQPHERDEEEGDAGTANALGVDKERARRFPDNVSAPVTD